MTIGLKMNIYQTGPVGLVIDILHALFAGLNRQMKSMIYASFVEQYFIRYILLL